MVNKRILFVKNSRKKLKRIRLIEEISGTNAKIREGIEHCWTKILSTNGQK